MIKNLDNRRTAIVTGSGNGLGQAMALGLVRVGIRVAVVDIDPEAVKSTVARAQAEGGDAIGLTADIGDENDCRRVVETTRRELGSVDILVNNAAVGPGIVRKDFWRTPIKVWEISPDAWRTTFRINTEGPFLMIRQVVPAMIERGWGRVINITTSLDTMIRSGCAPYGGSKAANEATLSALAQDLAGTGVTANILVPGGLANTGQIPSEVPIKREDMVQPEAMVPPLLWLVSPAADDVTGRRFTALVWDTTLPPAQAAEQAGAPMAWPQIVPPGQGARKTV